MKSVGRRWFLLYLVLLTPVLPAQDEASVYQAPDPEPTPEETVMLEYINRFRADPHAEAKRFLADTACPLNRFDNDMFLSEMKTLKAAGPLVFHLKLIDAARKHGHYMILNDIQSHDEISGKPGFTGKSFSNRCQAAGYAAAAGENIFLKGTNPWVSHMGYVIDWGEGPGGMQKGRGHRMNLIKADIKEIGVGGLYHADKKFWCSVHNTGRGEASRYAGGVMYVDVNDNGFYDIGEGLGGVVIKIGRETVTSWKSGAYTLPLKATGSVKATAAWMGYEVSCECDGPLGNVKFDANFYPKLKKDFDQLVLEIETLAQTLKKQHEDLEDLPDEVKAPLSLETSEDYRELQIKIEMSFGSLPLDDERQQKCRELTANTGVDLRQKQQDLLSAMQDLKPESDTDEVEDALSKHQKAYKKTAAENWFDEAEDVFKVLEKVLRFEKSFLKAKKISNPLKRKRSKIIKTLSDTIDELTHSDIKIMVQHVAGRIKSLKK